MYNVCLKDLVAAKLVERGLPGSVQIRPNKPLAARLESGERATFIVEYTGVGTARLDLPEYEISCGTVGASVVDALADKIERARSRDREPPEKAPFALTRTSSAGAASVGQETSP